MILSRRLPGIVVPWHQWGPQMSSSSGRCGCGHRQSARSEVAAAASLQSAPAAAAAAVGLLLLHPAGAAQAHISLASPRAPERAESELVRRQQALAAFDPSAAAQGRRGTASSSSTSSQRPPSPVASEASSALQQLAAANEALRTGDYAAALQDYSALVKAHPDLAFVEYARLGRAVCLYQASRVNEALVALNELEVSMRGNPELHAALAAVLWAERPSQRFRAEQQWDIAVEFDSRYADPAWVAAQKHWPPRLLAALEAFLALR